MKKEIKKLVESYLKERNKILSLEELQIKHPNAIFKLNKCN